MRKQKCDKCGWMVQNKDLKKISEASEVWGCPKCGGIFFVYCVLDDGGKNE